jgi:hypothetical protein
MPHLLIGQIQSTGQCPTCGVAAGEFCRSKTNQELRSYAHKGRADLPQLIIDRGLNGQKLADYPLAKRYEWEYIPMDYRRP